MMKKILDIWNRIKNFAGDLLINTFSFGIYIIAQQLVFMPTMGKLLSANEFANLVIYISIFSIISNVLGSELGIVRQVRENKNNGNDYNRILLFLFPIITIISMAILILLKYNLIDSICFTVIILLANIRLYALSCFRLDKKFKNVLFQNLLYLAGLVVGILLYKRCGYIWMPMLIAELCTLIYSFARTDIMRAGIAKTGENKEICKSFLDLGFISLLVNAMVYFDKMLVYPILGEIAVSIYYSTTSMSKVVSMITNPMHGVLISWIKGNDEKEKNKIVKYTLKVNIPVLIIVFVVSIPLTYFAVKILYEQYLEQSIALIIPVCIGLAFSTVSSLVKSVLLKYVQSKKLVITYLIYFAIFILISIPMSKWQGVVGFAYATAIAKFILWLEFLWILKKAVCLEGETKNEKRS